MVLRLPPTVATEMAAQPIDQPITEESAHWLYGFKFDGELRNKRIRAILERMAPFS
jgi:hypothetical protein